MSDIRKECIEWMKVTPSNKRDNYPDEYKKFLNCCKNMWYDNPQDMLKWVEGVWERKKRNRIFNRDSELAFKVIYHAYSRCNSIDAKTAPFIIDQKTDTIYVRRQEGGDTWLLDEINSMLPEDCKRFSEGSGFGLKDNSGREFEHNFVKFLWCLVRGEDCNLINENLKSNFKSTFKDIINSIQYEEERQ